MLSVRKVVSIGLVAAVAAVSGVSAALAQSESPSPAKDEKVVFTIGVNGDLNSANPLSQIDSTESFLTGLMYDFLLRLGQVDYTIEPELVESWEVSEDEKTWTFVLRDGLTWSDGEPLTAHDFEWTSKFIMANDISSYTDGYRFTESVEATDDRTIVWKTTKPTRIPGLPGYNILLPKHIWSEVPAEEVEEFKNFPNTVTSGPFTLVEWEPGEFWRLEAREDYYGGAPTIDEIVFRVYNSDEALVQALIKGEIDHSLVATPGLYESVKDKPGIEAAVTTAEAFHQLSFNLADDPGSTANPAVLDPVVREAVAWAIDRETLVDRVLSGYGTPGTTPIVPFYEQWHWEPPAEEAIGFDPAEAVRLLDEAGYVDTDDDGIRETPDGEPLDWRLFIATTDSPAIKAAPFIEEWLADVGIGVSTKSMADAKLFDQWYAYDWDMILYSWGTGPDPDFLLSSFTSKQCGYWSDTCWSNPEYDDLYAEQQTTLDDAERQEIVFRMQQMIYEATPEIVLWYPNAFEAWRADRWENLKRWPEPDGAVMWGNVYSAVAVTPLSGASSSSAEADSGLPAAVWILGAAAIVGIAVAVVAMRRRRGEHYAA